MSEKVVETAFLVALHTDGTFTAHLELPEEKIATERQATPADVLTISQNLVKEIESSQLTDRIVGTLMALMSQAAQVATPADAIKEKLAERGIKPESTPVED